MSRLSILAVCLLVVFAGCVGGGGGDGGAADDSTATVAEDGGSAGGGSADDESVGADAAGGSGADAGSDGDQNAGSGSSGSEDVPDVIPLLRTDEHYEYDVRSDVLADAPEDGTLTIDVTEGGEWPDVAMDVVREAPSGRLAATDEMAAFSPALGEMTYALNMRSLVVSSRMLSGESTDLRTYEVGDSWRFDSSDTEAGFEVVAEERVAGMTAKRVHVTGGAESDLNADIWLVPGVGFPVKYVQTEDGEVTIALTLTAYESA